MNLSPTNYDFSWLLRDRAGRSVYIDRAVYEALHAFRLSGPAGQTIIWDRPAETGVSLEHARRAILAALDFLGCRARFTIEPTADHPDAFTITRLPGLRPLPAAIRRAKRDLNRKARDALSTAEARAIILERVELENSIRQPQPLPYRKRGRPVAATSRFGWETLSSPDDVRFFQASAAALHSSFYSWKRVRGLDTAKITCVTLADGKTTAVSRVR
jgi:hypothetical protein